MVLKFNPDASFQDNLTAVMGEVQDLEVRATLQAHIQTIIGLAETNTQVRRQQLIDDLKKLIEERSRKAVGQ